MHIDPNTLAVLCLPQRAAYFGVAGRGVARLKSLPNPDIPAMPLAQTKLAPDLRQSTPFVVPFEVGNSVVQNLCIRLGLDIAKIKYGDDELPELSALKRELWDVPDLIAPDRRNVIRLNEAKVENEHQAPQPSGWSQDSPCST